MICIEKRSWLIKMKEEDYKNFINILETFEQTLDNDLAQRTHFFEGSNSNFFQKEYQILKTIRKLVDDIRSII